MTHGPINIRLLDLFSKNTQVPNFIKILLLGVELFRTEKVDRRRDGGTDRQTDMTKLIIAFHNFANAFKTEHAFISVHCKETLNF